MSESPALPPREDSASLQVPGTRGNKDKRLIFNTPCAYAIACQTAKENGTLAGYLQNVADELSGFDSRQESSSEDVAR